MYNNYGATISYDYFLPFNHTSDDEMLKLENPTKNETSVSGCFPPSDSFFEDLQSKNHSPYWDSPDRDDSHTPTSFQDSQKVTSITIDSSNPTEVLQDSEPTNVSFLCKGVFGIIKTFLNHEVVYLAHFNELESKDQNILHQFFNTCLTTIAYRRFVASLKEKQVRQTLVIRFQQTDLASCMTEKRKDAVLKQVLSAAFQVFRKAFKKLHFPGMKGLALKAALDKKVLQSLLEIEPDQVTDELLKAVVTDYKGVTREYVSAITMNGQNLNLLRRLIQTIESGAARDLYFQEKAMVQLERTLAGPSPFSVVKKTRKAIAEGKPNLETYETFPKIPVTRREFEAQCRTTAAALRQYCRELHIEEDKLRSLPVDPQFEKWIDALELGQTLEQSCNTASPMTEESFVPPEECRRCECGRVISPHGMTSLPSTPKKLSTRSPGSVRADRKANTNIKVKKSVANQHRKPGSSKVRTLN